MHKLHLFPALWAAVCFFTAMKRLCCAQLAHFWGQAVQSIWTNCVRISRLHTAHYTTLAAIVRNYLVDTATLTGFTHSQPRQFLQHFTDIIRHLSTISTPPTITTTKYIKI